MVYIHDLKGLLRDSYLPVLTGLWLLVKLAIFHYRQ